MIPGSEEAVTIRNLRLSKSVKILTDARQHFDGYWSFLSPKITLKRANILGIRIKLAVKNDTFIFEGFIRKQRE